MAQTLGRFAQFADAMPSKGDLNLFQIERARASATLLGIGLAFSGVCVAIAIWSEPAFLVLLAPPAVGTILLSLFLIWSQCTLEIDTSSKRLRLRERTVFRENIREWDFKDIPGLTIFGDDPNLGFLQLTFPYGVRISLGGGDRAKLRLLGARISELTGIRFE